MDKYSLASLLRKGKLRKEMAEIFNVSLSTLDRALRKWKLTRKNWGAGKLKYKLDDVKRLYLVENYTQEQLAKMLKVRRETINKIVNNRTYRKIADVSFSGTADVNLILKYEAN